MEGGSPTNVTEMSEVGRLGGIFFAPTETYQAIARRPTFLVPLLVLTILSLGLTWWIGQRMGWELVVRQQMEQSARVREMPVEQREQMIRDGVARAPVFGYVFGALSTPVIALVVGGVLLFVFNVLAGSEMTFRGVFSVVSWALMPLAVATLLAFLIVGLKPPEDIDVQNLVASNVGALFDPNRTAAPLLAFLRALDLFTAWQVFLLATGLSSLNPRLSFRKALTGVVISWAVWVAVKVGWAAIFS
jgi:hypothetical protein